MAITRLQLYNIALIAIGERTISALTDAVESRRLLDEVWDRGNGAVKYFLEQGLWNFALRAAQIAEDTSATPAFGFTAAFSVPTDFVRVDMISADERFNSPLNNYEMETGYFYADVTTLYLRYVSDGNSYGNNLSLWPESFSLWAGHWLGTQICPVLKNPEDTARLKKEAKQLLLEAQSKDASQEPTRFAPLGNWASARRGRSVGDRGSRTRLIG